MYVGYDESGEQPCPYSDLDEFLCEYVDGEMDPAVRAAFEEIVSRDPALAEHVECLRQTRAMLCEYSRRVGAPCSLHARLHYVLSRELMQEEAPVLTPVTSRLGRVAGFASAVVLALAMSVYLLDSPRSDAVLELADTTPPAQTVVSAPVAQPAPHYRLSVAQSAPTPTTYPLFEPPYHTGFGKTISVVHTQSALQLNANGTLLHTAGFTSAPFSRVP